MILKINECKVTCTGGPNSPVQEALNDQTKVAYKKTDIAFKYSFFVIAIEKNMQNLAGALLAEKLPVPTSFRL